MNVADLFRLLGDPMRLRILRLLGKEKLNVSELVEILGMAQSGISRHLRLLRDAGLVAEMRESGWAYYVIDPKTFSNGTSRLWPLLKEQLNEVSEARQDDVRLQEVLRERQEEFREKTSHGIAPGRSWAAWARTLSYLMPAYTVADLGCGEGYLTLEVARWAGKVIAIDSSRAMLEHGKTLAKKRGVKNVIWKYGFIEKLPLEDRSVDIVLMAQVLHCLQDPAGGLKQANRILKDGGSLLIEELRTHEEDWVRDKYGDVRLGFEPAELKTLLRQTGFVDIKLDIGARRRGDPFTVLIGYGKKKD